MPDVASGGAIVSGGASIINSLFGGNSGSDAGDAAIQAAQIQAAAADRSGQLQKQMYDSAVARSAPWVNAGTAAVNQYAGILNLPGYAKIDPTEYLRSTPGYQFDLNQGVQARDRSAASRGMLYSGPQLKAVTAYGQGLADKTYNSLMDRIYGLSGQGQNAAALTGSQGIASGQNIGNTYMQGAQAEAQGLYNAYNARESAYGNQQNNLMSGIGMATNALTKVAPYVSNWWGGGSSGSNSGYPVGSDAFYENMYSTGGY